MERAKPIYRATFTIRKGVIDNRAKLFETVTKNIEKEFEELAKNSGCMRKIRTTENGGISYDYYHENSGLWYGRMTTEKTPKGNRTKVTVCGYWFEQLPYTQYAQKVEYLTRI